MKTWRSIAKPIIAKVIREVGTDDMKALRKALSDAYPFGVKQYHPYKVWLDEIKFQLGQKKHLNNTPRPDNKPLPGQKELF